MIRITTGDQTIDIHTYDKANLRVPTVAGYPQHIMSIPKNNVILRNKNNDTIEFFDVKIDVTKANNIVSTPLVNRHGEIKEFIQQQDYTIKFSGNIIEERGIFPYEELKKLNDILNEEDSLDVSSAYLNCFGITKIALENAIFNQSIKSHYNLMPFTLNFKSDMDYEFLIMDNQ
jgi:hypothetical protein